MLTPEQGPFLFDTSAESWFLLQRQPEASRWLTEYLGHHAVHVSSITVYERARGYALLASRGDGESRQRALRAYAHYLKRPGTVLPVSASVAAVAAEIAVLAPFPPSSRTRSHRMRESKGDRLARWRLDQLIAATALVHNMVLIHNNPVDFEAIRMAIELSDFHVSKLGPLQLSRSESVYR